MAGDDSRLNKTKLAEPYLFSYETPTGGKRYLAQVAGSGFKGSIKRAFPFTPEGKKQALNEIQSFLKTNKIPEGIKKLTNPPDPEKPWRYKTFDKGTFYFKSKAEAEKFKADRIKGKVTKQTKIPTSEYKSIVTRIKAGETLEEIAESYKAGVQPLRKMLRENGTNYSQLTPNVSYTEDPELRKIFKDNYKKLSQKSLANKLFPNDELKTAVSKYVTLRDKLNADGEIKVTKGYTDELKQSFKMDPKSVLDRKTRVRRDNLIKKVSDLDIERYLKEAKIGSGLDQAHRLSLAQTKAVNELYNVLNLGIESPDINRESIKTFEDALDKLYKDQNKLVKQAKGLDKIPEELSFKLEEVNKKISNVVDATDGRLQGILVDELNLKPSVYGTNYIKSIGMGLIDKDVKNMTQADIDLAKALIPIQLENERAMAAADKVKLGQNIVLIDDLVKDIKSVRGGCQIIVKRALGAKGGLFNETCESIIRAKPIASAVQLDKEITATKGPLKKLKDDAQKLIRLYRGEGFNLRTGPSIKEMAKTFGVSEAEAKKKLLSGQWFTSDPVASASYTDKLGKTKYVDVTPKEFMDFKRYVNRVNKTKSLSGGERYPVGTQDKLSIVPKYKLDEFEKADRLKSERNIFKDFTTKSGYMERAEGVLSYDSVKGGFVDPADPTTIVNQDQIKAWAEANPEKVTAGTEAVEATTNKSVISNVAKSLARVGAPLPVAAIDSYFIGKQVAEGKGTAEIASNPLNWLGLATMEPLAKASGIAQPGKLNAILRLGLNPATIRGITRFAGLPGLAVSTAMTAYDQYQKYKDGEGFIFNLLNQKGTE